MRETLLRRGPELRRRALLATVFLAPLLFMRNLYDPINLPKLWLVTVAVVVVGALRIAEVLQGASRSTLRLLVIPAGAVLIPLIVGWIFSPYRVWALMGDAFRYTGLIPYVVLLLLGVLIADAFAGEVRPLAWAIVASGAVAGAYALLQLLGLDPLEWTYQGQTSRLVASTLGNPNFAGGFFSIVLPIAAALVWLEPERRPLAGACAALVLVGWVGARSETAWGAGVAGLLVFAGGLLVKRFRWALVAAFAATGLIAVIGVGLVANSIVFEDPGVTPHNLERRGEWWEASLRMFGDSPLVGRGPNAFALEHSRYRTLRDVEEAGPALTDDPHSVPLSLATAGGLFGVAGFLVLAGWIVITTWEAAQLDRWALAFGAAACAYLVQSLLSIDTVALRVAAWTSVGGLAAALIERVEPAATQRRAKKKGAARAAAQPLKGLPGIAVVVLVGMLGIWWATNLVAADAAAAGARASLDDGEAQAAQDSFQRALEFRANETYVRLYGDLMAPVAVGLVQNDAEEPGRALFEEIRAAFRSVSGLDDSYTTLAFASALETWAEVEPSAEEEAMEQYERAARLDPKDHVLFHQAAVAATSFGDLERAEELLQRALALADEPQLWGQLGLVYAQEGEREEALAAIEKALELDPADEAALEAQDLLDR